MNSAQEPVSYLAALSPELVRRFHVTRALRRRLATATRAGTTVRAEFQR